MLETSEFVGKVFWTKHIELYNQCNVKILGYKHSCFQRMSLSLLKAELEAATKDLKTAVKGETHEQGLSSTKAVKRKGEGGGGPKNIKKRGVNFKFAPDFVGKEDRTAECLAALEKLDRGSKVKAAGMHMMREKRRESDTGKKKGEVEGTLFTEEDFANFEKDLFLHSKPKMPKGDD